MQTATSETERKSPDLSICVHHYTLRAPCPNGQGREFQIGLCGVVEADLELFCNSWSEGFLGEQLYSRYPIFSAHQKTQHRRTAAVLPKFPHSNSCSYRHVRPIPCAEGPKPSSRARLLLGVFGRTDNLQTALGLCQGGFFPGRAPKSSVRRDRCISTRKKRDTA